MEKKLPFALPVRIADDKYLVGSDSELITELPSATTEECEAIVALINQSLDIESICLTAMYMAMGADQVISKMHTNGYELMSEKRGGHIGINADLSDLAVESEAHLKSLGVTEFPGVYDYEVSGPFGEWFAENDPDYDTAVEKLHSMIAAFLAQDEVAA